jgi:hypothetical protein
MHFYMNNKVISLNVKMKFKYLFRCSLRVNIASLYFTKVSVCDDYFYTQISISKIPTLDSTGTFLFDKINVYM